MDAAMSFVAAAARLVVALAVLQACAAVVIVTVVLIAGAWMRPRSRPGTDVTASACPS
jgi:3-deoxy-D-arabino-heptulosonate 7-phosphate (DAHP) synthase class II